MQIIYFDLQILQATHFGLIIILCSQTHVCKNLNCHESRFPCYTARVYLVYFEICFVSFLLCMSFNSFRSVHKLNSICFGKLESDHSIFFPDRELRKSIFQVLSNRKRKSLRKSFLTFTLTLRFFLKEGLKRAHPQHFFFLGSKKPFLGYGTDFISSKHFVRQECQFQKQRNLLAVQSSFDSQR